MRQRQRSSRFRAPVSYVGITLRSMAGGSAGGSARGRAEEYRRKAKRLEKQADRWDQGAYGEEMTAALLSPLEPAGYAILHDLQIPGSQANIDHVVIGPNGVTVVDTKSYTGRLRISDGTLWNGRYPLRRELAALEFERSKVNAVVSVASPGVAVRSVICVHAAAVPADPRGELAPAGLCSAPDLVALVTAGTQRPLDGADIDRLRLLLAAAFPSKASTRSAPSASSRVTGTRTSAPRSRRPGWRAAGRLLDRAASRVWRLAVLVVVAILLGVLGIVAALAAYDGFVDSVKDLGSTTTTPTPGAPTVPAG